MEFELKYGKDKVKFNLSEKNYMGTILPNMVQFHLIDEPEVKRAIQNPIGSNRLKDIVKPGEKIAIITSDITRPMPSYKVLPEIISELKQGGIKEEDITIVLALGSHRSHTEDEKKALVGEKTYFSGINIIDSNMKDCIRLGVCTNGTPVDIFRPVDKADRRICVGNIEFHYFAGYSGGSKAIMPGVSSHEAIQANHSNMVKPGAFAGNIDTNPVRQDIDEVIKFISIDFIVNVVLNDKKQIVKAFAGDVIKAHRAGCKLLDEMYKITVNEKSDIVIVSPGGYPKDINIYQSQKGLDNSKHAVKEGGIIIWCASAAEGFGEKVFEQWMTTKTPNEMINEIKSNFKLGGHKAAAIALILEKVKIYMVSDLPSEIVQKLNLTPFSSVQDAVDYAISELGDKSKVLVMPQAGSTLPSLY